MALKKKIPAGAPVVAAAPSGTPKATPKRPTVATTSSVQAINKDKILELINRRQRQIIVHSVIYYRMNGNIIVDDTWNAWARELVKLHKDYPQIAAQSVFWDDMKDFDGTTGYHLADHVWGVKVAPSLMRNML